MNRVITSIASWFPGTPDACVTMKSQHLDYPHYRSSLVCHHLHCRITLAILHCRREPPRWTAYLQLSVSNAEPTKILATAS